MISTDQYRVIFNETDLAAITGVDLYNHNFNRLPQRDIKIYKIARDSLSIVTSSEYTQKEITVYMDVCSGSRANTEATVDTLKGIVQPQNGTLKVLQGGSSFEYTATLNEFDVVFDSARASVVLTFLASTPIGESVDAVSLINASGITDGYEAFAFTISGSAEAKPTINILIANFTGSGAIIIGNLKTGQAITLEETWTPGDILIIDSKEKIVTLNDAEIDFTGIFPVFGVGSQTLTYTDELTTRTVDITAQYNKRII